MHDGLSADELKGLKRSDPDRYRRELDAIAERRGFTPTARKDAPADGRRTGIDQLIEHLRKAYGLTEGQTSQLGLIRRGAVYACVTLRADMLAGIPIRVYRFGHLPDSVCAMALAWLSAAPKAVMTGRLSA